MKVVYKYPLFTTHGSAIVCVPADAKILHVAHQIGTTSFAGIMLWIELDPGKAHIARRFGVFNTGEPLPEEFDLTFIGTVLLNQGEYVKHIYEMKEKHAVVP